MPELPEVETIARGVDERLRGDRIETVWFSEKPEPFSSPPQLMAKELHGRRIDRVHRVGKHIVFDLADRPACITWPAMDRAPGHDRPPAGRRSCYADSPAHTRRSASEVGQGAPLCGPPALRTHGAARRFPQKDEIQALRREPDRSLSVFRPTSSPPFSGPAAPLSRLPC